MIYLYILSNIFYCYVVKKKNISIKNVFVFIFWGFLVLYPSAIYALSVSPFESMFPKIINDYISDTFIVQEVLFTSSLSLLTFAFCLKKYSIKEETSYYANVINNIYIKRFFWCFLPIALFFNSISNWTTGDRVGLIPTITAYTRNILTVVSVILFVSPSISFKKKLLYLLCFMVVTFLSTQRTNALIVIIAFVYNIKSEAKARLYLLFGILALIVLGSLRNGVSVTNFAYPIMGEGIFGSWGLLQAIDVTRMKGYSFEQLFMLFNSSVNWLLKMLHIPFLLPELGDIISKAGEEYYPMGGFFFISDAYLLHPLIGSILYTLFIFYLYRKNINKYYMNHNPLNLICVALLFDAVKGALSTFVAMLVFHWLFYQVIKLYAKKKKITLIENFEKKDID